MIYYLSDAQKGSGTEDPKRASKKERRKAKKEREREQPEARETSKQTGKNAIFTSICLLIVRPLDSKARASTVEADPLERLPSIDESTVGSLSEQVRGADEKVPSD